VCTALKAPTRQLLRCLLACWAEKKKYERWYLKIINFVSKLVYLLAVKKKILAAPTKRDLGSSCSCNNFRRAPLSFLNGSPPRGTVWHVIIFVWSEMFRILQELVLVIVKGCFSLLGINFLRCSESRGWHAFSEKMEKIYGLKVWIFCKMHHRIPFFLALPSSARRFQMPLEGLRFVKTLTTFGIIYATDPILQNMTEIVCLRWLTFDNFNYNPCRPWLITCANFSKSHALSLKRRRWPPIFMAFLTQVTYYLIKLENFRANVFK